MVACVACRCHQRKRNAKSDFMKKKEGFLGVYFVCFGYSYTSGVAGILCYSSCPQSSCQPARQRPVLHCHLRPLGATTGAQGADHSLQPDLLRGGLHGRRGSDGRGDELRSSEVSFVLPGRSALSSCLLVALLALVGPAQCVLSEGLTWLFLQQSETEQGSGCSCGISLNVFQEWLVTGMIIT